MNKVKRAALIDISKETTVLIDTDVDPFKGMYRFLNNEVLRTNYHRKYRTKSNKSIKL